MSDANDVLYKSLESKVYKLMEHIRFLKNAHAQLTSQIAQQEEAMNQMQQQLKEEQEKNKLLKEAGVLSMIDKKDVGQLQQKINSLVREIENCKALMMEE